MEAYIESLGVDQTGQKPSSIALMAGEAASDGSVPFTGKFVPPDSGRYEITLRAMPYHPELAQAAELGLVTWLGSQPAHEQGPGMLMDQPVTEELGAETNE